MKNCNFDQCEKSRFCVLCSERFSQGLAYYSCEFLAQHLSVDEKEYMIFKIAIRDKFTRIKLTHNLTVGTTNLILKLLGAGVNICVTKIGERGEVWSNVQKHLLLHRFS